jgi:hypothetical protein
LTWEEGARNVTRYDVDVTECHVPFVKLDCGLLESSTWLDRPALEVFLTALLLAEPFELPEPTPALGPHEIEPNGWLVPAGWYGLARVAPPLLMERATMGRQDPVEDLQDALTRLCDPDAHSRSSDFGGRRLARVNGGFIVLNYDRYRQRDYTAAERTKRWRDKRRAEAALHRSVTDKTRSVTALSVTVTQAEAEADIQIPATDPFPNTQRGQVSPVAQPAPKLNGKKPKRNTAHFVQADFAVTEEDKTWARENFPTVDLWLETGKFRDHEFNAPRSDWRRAWRNWIRKAGAPHARP